MCIARITLFVSNTLLSNYRKKHKAPKTYQTAFGPVEIERGVYANRKKDGDGKSIVPFARKAYA